MQSSNPAEAREHGAGHRLTRTKIDARGSVVESEFDPKRHEKKSNGKDQHI
jgi:hypothetical protein